MRIRKGVFVAVRILIFIFVFVASAGLIQQTYAQDTKRPNNGFMPALSPDGTMVAFVSDQDERRDLWLMNADGSSPINVTTALKNTAAYLPEWSPDSRHILFLSIDFSHKDSLSDLWLVLLDTRKLQLLATALPLANPKWSPDGKSIAFELYDKNIDKRSLWIIDSDGENRRQLISGDGNSSLRWSPDGKSITYLSGIGSQTQLNLTEIDTGKTRTLSTNSIWGYAWAPRSNLIAYITQKPDDIWYSDIWLVQTDTASEFKLTDKPVFIADELAWSPDEEKIVFRSGCGTSAKVTDILVLYLKQRSTINITSCQQSFNSDVSWFPDSEHILFRSNRSGAPSIWVMASGGTNAVDLIDRAN